MPDEPRSISHDHLASAEKISGLAFTTAERELMLEDVNQRLADYEKLRAISIDNAVPPAVSFDPRVPGMKFDHVHRRSKFSRVKTPPVPSDLEDLAFLPVMQLARLIKARQVTSLQLTEMYLNRLKRYDPVLKCVVTLTEDLALRQAQRADEEIAAGHYRGLLHGIPYGAKDLLAVRGYPTTWGATPYKDQVIDLDATVIDRLAAAGAVLIAKLTLGSLAWDDEWFGGQTKNPWNLNEGSSGSSAGPGAATTAGLVGFSIGTETWGSIVSPSTRCRVTGLRPTFGRVSRYGAMALSWSMDKIGPMCRSVEDCAVVFDAIYGPDGQDLSVVDLPFNWDARIDATQLRVGYVKSAFDEERENQANDAQSLAVLQSLGFKLTPVALPDLPIGALSMILNVEAAAAFDELTRSNRDDLLERQVKDAWPNVLRQSRLIPAVEYIQANRIRTLAMQAMAKLMNDIDVYVAPSFAGDNLLLTNLTGHPAVVVPNGVTEKGASSSVTFTGRLYGEAPTLAVAKAYQDATDFHWRHPKM